MGEFEYFVQGPENLSETGIESNEIVGATKICNFEGCDLISNENLVSYLSENLPPSHLEGCPSIQYDPNDPMFSDLGALGYYECGSHSIHIADESKFSNGREGLLDTVTHEVGHNAYDCLIKNHHELSEKWDQLDQESWNKFANDGKGFVSDYARTNKFEDFAESYKTYVRDPEILQIMSPEKYTFLHDYVFAGKEYQPTTLAYWTTDSGGNKVEVTGTGVYNIWGSKISNS